MTSLVLELQRAAMSPAEKVADVVRKASVVATKLGLSAFKEWCESELNGYGDKAVPRYRSVRGQLKAFNPYNGWIPVMIFDGDIMERLSSREIGQSIGELQHLYETRSDDSNLQIPLPHEWIQKIFKNSPEYRLGMIPTLLVGHAQLYGILEAVRNRILEWSLELEAKGVFGEGLTFTKDEVTKASHVVYNIGAFSGVLGNVSSSQLQIGDYNSIHSELKRLGISQEERNELEAVLDEMPKADPPRRESLAKQGLAWVMKNASGLGVLSDTIRGWFDSAMK